MISISSDLNSLNKARVINPQGKFINRRNNLIRIDLESLDPLDAVINRKEDMEQLLEELENWSDNSHRSLFKLPNNSIKSIEVADISSRNQDNIHENTKVP